MFKIVKYFIIFLFLASSLNLFAQNQEPISNSDSLKNSDASSYKLRINPFLNYHKLFLGQKNLDIKNNEYKQISQLNLEKDSSESLSEMKIKLKNYLSKRRNLIPNYDLGDFGKYLGYAQTMAAFILALISVL